MMARLTIWRKCPYMTTSISASCVCTAMSQTAEWLSCFHPYVIAKVKFDRLHYAYGYDQPIGISNATASLKISLRLLRLRSPTAPTNYYQSSNWYISSAVMLQHVLQRRSIALCMLYACYTFQSQRNVSINQSTSKARPGLKPAKA